MVNGYVIVVLNDAATGALDHTESNAHRDCCNDLWREPNVEKDVHL